MKIWHDRAGADYYLARDLAQLHEILATQGDAWLIEEGDWHPWPDDKPFTMYQDAADDRPEGATVSDDLPPMWKYDAEVAVTAPASAWLAIKSDAGFFASSEI